MAQVNSLVSWWWEVIKDEPTLAAVTVSILILAILWYRLTILSSSNGAPPLPPGPRSLPVVGYLPFLSTDLHTQFTDLAHRYGPIFKIHLGSKLHIVINTPDLAKAVVRDQDDVFANRTPSVVAKTLTYGGKNIAWSDNNSYWRNLRKILVQEVLSNKNLDACSVIRSDEIRKTIKNVYSKIGTPIDLREISFWTEANVLTNMVWEDSSDGRLGAELQMVVSKVVELLGQPNVSDFFPSLAWFDLQGVNRDMKRHLKHLDRIFATIIDDRMKSNSIGSNNSAGEERKKDFLQVLLDLKDQKDAAISLDITNIKAVLMDIMVAGTETTSTSIEYTMAEIMRNEDVMKSVQKELTEVVGSNNTVKESHLPQLIYLDAAIKEAFRLHPAVPLLLPHSPSQTCTVGGYTIPKGCTVFLNVWSIQRDPRYWENPLEFNPERFLTSEDKNKLDFKGNNLKYLPFGSGRRLCPGIPLADKMQMHILASLLHSFDWSLPEGEDHDLSGKFGITLKKRKPLIAIPSPRLPNMTLYM